MSKLIDLVKDQTSPLFRIKSVFNYDHRPSMKMLNNILCSHIGNGYFISVAHNLKSDYQIPLGVPDAIFEKDFLACFSETEKNMLRNRYQFDKISNKHILKGFENENEQELLRTKIQSCSFDTSYVYGYANGLVKPYLIVQFEHNQFYNSPALTALIGPQNYFNEQSINKHSFIIELEIASIFYEHDIAIYRAVNTDPRVIQAIPVLDIDFNTYDGTEGFKFYCLQSSPSSEMGRLLNTATIDGISQHWGIQNNVKPPTIMEGLRYIMKGYFRFGSSGAPYLVLKDPDGDLQINAVQSEACPQQLLINNSQEGNAQYINGIATPIGNLQQQISNIINPVVRNDRPTNLVYSIKHP